MLRVLAKEGVEREDRFEDDGNHRAHSNLTPFNRFELSGCSGRVLGMILTQGAKEHVSNVTATLSPSLRSSARRTSAGIVICP
jgi:hypothetical protein